MSAGASVPSPPEVPVSTTSVSQPLQKIATRESYGKALAALGAERPDVYVLDADLSGSTKTNVFAKAFPQRFFNIGVAEANMIGIASGLSSTGLTVFCSSFAMFATGKAYEQVRQEVALPNANVKICATHAGLTVGEDGASHQMLEDLAIMRVLPNLRVVVPSDGFEAEQVIRAAASTPGPFYVRLSRLPTALFLPPDYQFQLGRAARLREGNDVTLIGAGVTHVPVRARVRRAVRAGHQGARAQRLLDQAAGHRSRARGRARDARDRDGRGGAARRRPRLGGGRVRERIPPVPRRAAGNEGPLRRVRARRQAARTFRTHGAGHREGGAGTAGPPLRSLAP